MTLESRARRARERAEATPGAHAMAAGLDPKEALVWVLAGHEAKGADHCDCGATIGAGPLAHVEHQAEMVVDVIRLARENGPRKAAQRVAAAVIDRQLRAA